MNNSKTAHIILIIATIVIALMIIFPPWHVYYSYGRGDRESIVQDEGIAYHFVAYNPYDLYKKIEGYRLQSEMEYRLLLLQIVLVFLIAFFFYKISQKGNNGRDL